MNKVAAFALRRKNSILSMSEKMFCPPQPLRFWITPACAGKSLFVCHAVVIQQDHPRVCGEKAHDGQLGLFDQGSPPRVRGKEADKMHRFPHPGITPACAGKRDNQRLQTALHGDHPRVCGEKHCTSTPIALVSGSPPRMRGKAVEMKLAGTVHGITPACAGKRGCRCSGL